MDEIIDKIEELRQEVLELLDYTIKSSRRNEIIQYILIALTLVSTANAIVSILIFLQHKP